MVTQIYRHSYHKVNMISQIWKGLEPLEHFCCSSVASSILPVFEIKLYFDEIYEELWYLYGTMTVSISIYSLDIGSPIADITRYYSNVILIRLILMERQHLYIEHTDGMTTEGNHITTLMGFLLLVKTTSLYWTKACNDSGKYFNLITYFTVLFMTLELCEFAPVFHRTIVSTFSTCSCPYIPLHYSSL